MEEFVQQLLQDFQTAASLVLLFVGWFVCLFSQYKDIEGYGFSSSDVNMNERQCVVCVHFSILLRNAAIASASFLFFPLCVCECVSVCICVCAHVPFEGKLFL